MAEAWAKRGSERQRLIEELMQEVYKIEEAVPGESMHGGERIEFELDLIQAIAAHLKQRAYPRDPANKVDQFASSSFFSNDILPRVSAFSRAEEETNELLCMLVRKLYESVETHFQSELSKLEFSDPQKIFHAPSAMAEVPLERRM